MLNRIKYRVLQGEQITRDEAIQLAQYDPYKLATSANQIREHFCHNQFHLCSIINGKSGQCSENCKYCAQSIHYNTNIDVYDHLDTAHILDEAKHNDQKGVRRFSIVTSGRTLSDSELSYICSVNQAIQQSCKLSICASHGLLRFDQFQQLKASGVTRYHNNLETSRRYFPYVCTTHTYEDKIIAIRAARKAGLEICSGGIIGMGETMEDRIDLAFTLRELNITSIPINILSPIPGTPFAIRTPMEDDEIIQTVAIFRFILPTAMIRLAGGRGRFQDKGKQLFLSGANAAITGDMLTTQGISIDDDKTMLKKLGYQL